MFSAKYELNLLYFLLLEIICDVSFMELENGKVLGSGTAKGDILNYRLDMLEAVLHCARDTRTLKQCSFNVGQR